MCDDDDDGDDDDDDDDDEASFYDANRINKLNERTGERISVSFH